MSALAMATPTRAAPREILPGTVRAPNSDLTIELLGLRHRAIWDRYVRSHADGTLFHTVAWMDSVRATFGHRPHYLLARSGTEVAGVLPLFEVRSLLAGTMLVSVPYAVAGGIISDTSAATNGLLREAKRIANSVGAGTIDFRSERPRSDELVTVDRYVTFRRELPDRADDVLDWLPRKARAAARNAETKHGLTVEFAERHLLAVWRLYCRSMRRLGSICYPFEFFEALRERHRADAFVQVARYRGKIIGGLMSFRYGDVFMPYFVGCDERFNGFNTNNFVYMSAMRKAVELGCRVFDFGRSRVDNKGSYDFKRFHGFEPRPLGYQRYVREGSACVELTPNNPKFRVLRQVWRRLPMPICRRLGAWASHHIPG
jgi:FemAB-related protein (PEP-CTERM system-associated)